MEVSPARRPGTVMNLGRLFRGPVGCREFLRVDDFCEAHTCQTHCAPPLHPTGVAPSQPRVATQERTLGNVSRQPPTLKNLQSRPQSGGPWASEDSRTLFGNVRPL